MDERPQNPDVKPHFDVHRRTTKVNIGTVTGVVLFLALMFGAVFYFMRNSDRTIEEQHQRAESRP